MVSLITSIIERFHPTTGAPRRGERSPAQDVAQRALDSPRGNGRSLFERAKPLSGDQREAVRAAVAGQETTRQERGEPITIIVISVVVALFCVCFWTAVCLGSGE